MKLNAFPLGLAQLAAILNLSQADCEELAQRFPGGNFVGLVAALKRPDIIPKFHARLRACSLDSGPDAALAEIERILQQQARDQQTIKQQEERTRRDQRGGRGR